MTWLCILLCPYACFAAQSESIIITVCVDGIPPQNPTILIEEDETHTNSLDVSLSLGAEDASHMIISQDPDFSDAQWQTFTTSMTFGLSSGDDTKTVYVKYKDEVGNQTEAVSDSIILDTTPPEIIITSPQDGALVNTPTLTLEGTVDEVAFSESYTLTEGENTITKTATDAAGNTSSVSITVTLDTIPPEIIISSPQANSIFTTPGIILEGTIDGVYFSESRTLQDIGDNTVVKEATDAAGNSNSASVVVIYNPGELIGPEGGTVTSPDGSIRLIIPEGALLEPARISVSRLNPTIFEGKIPDNYSSEVAVRCEPMGLVLQKEAQLILKLDKQEVPGTEVDLGLYNNGLGEVELLGQSSPVASDGFTVGFSLWHFSEYLGLKNMVSQGAPIGGGVQIPLPDLLTGSYSYDVPIVVPPGRAKMQPGISIKYNSSNSNSWVGYGWNLNPGYIMRSTKHGIPSYNDTEDIFILVSGNSTTELVHLVDNLYQARVESEFSRFYKETDDSWKVVQKDGAILRFGTTQDSKETSQDGTFSWKLTRVIDNNGNYIVLFYIKDEGKSYLSSIDYTGNENTLFSPAHTISFYLEDRDDVVSSYVSGSKILMRKRLRTIEVSIGYNLIWRYELNYEYAPETSRSLLKSVQRFTSDGKLFPEQRFYYQNHDGQLQ